VAGGTSSKVTVGAVASTVKLRVAFAELPAASVTITWNVCGPSTCAGAVNEAAQLTSVWLSMWHWVVSGVPPVVNVKAGVGSLVSPLGPPVIDTVGGVPSTMKSRDALVELPAASVTMTSNLRGPSASEVDVNVPAVQLTRVPPSMWHCVVVGEPPVANVKVGVRSVVTPVGPVWIVTVGAVASTVKLRVAVAELPAASVTMTSNVCGPSNWAGAVYGVPQLVSASVSMWHRVVVGEPPVVNVNVGDGSLVRPLGPPVIDTVGGTRSTSHANVAVAVLPIGSVARTRNMREPAATAGPSHGELHAVNVTTPSI